MNYDTDFFDVLTKFVNDTFSTSDIMVEQTKLEFRTCPDVSRVIFNGDCTIVHFNDNTKIVVKRGAGDPEDRQTAIVYAIAKRLFWTGKYDKKRNLDTTGFYSWIQRLVDSGFDQQTAEATEDERKAKAKAEHAAKQAAEHDAAVKRRAARKIKALEVDREVEKILAETLDKKHTSMLCEKEVKSKCLCKSNKTANSLNNSAENSLTKTSSNYVRPNKKFKDFNQDEKRAYWRNANKKRKQI